MRKYRGETSCAGGEYQWDRPLWIEAKPYGNGVIDAHNDQGCGHVARIKIWQEIENISYANIASIELIQLHLALI